MRCWVLLLTTFAACAGAPVEPVPTVLTVPDTAAAGVTAFDAEPPAGAILHARPQWQIGDEFELQRGGKLRLRFRVAAIDERGYVIESGGQVVLRRDLELGNLGEWAAADDRALHWFAPVDARFHWPLWVGKTWSCDFVEAFAGGTQAAMRASYVVEDLDTVVVPAGTFAALRIVRSLDRVDDPAFATRTQVIWYAPAVGHEVRQIFADQAIELVAIELAGNRAVRDGGPGR